MKSFFGVAGEVHCPVFYKIKVSLGVRGLVFEVHGPPSGVETARARADGGDAGRACSGEDLSVRCSALALDGVCTISDQFAHTAGFTRALWSKNARIFFFFFFYVNLCGYACTT